MNQVVAGLLLEILNVLQRNVVGYFNYSVADASASDAVQEVEEVCFSH